MKKITYGIIVVGIIGLLAFSLGRNKTEAPTIFAPEIEQEIIQQQNPEKFIGEYQDYDTGCFTDGTCAAIIDGKKVITIIGWSQDASGVFDDPDIDFGTMVEVFAHKIDEDIYTLYGSKNYYIKEIKN